MLVHPQFSVECDERKQADIFTRIGSDSTRTVQISKRVGQMEVTTYIDNNPSMKYDITATTSIHTEETDCVELVVYRFWQQCA